ncbi:MAG: DNA translocase FtsK [Coriobacteriales bacterium]
MLYSTPKLGKPLRIQGCFVDEGEINAVCKFLREQGKPDYHEDIFTTSVPVLESGGGSSSGAGSDDELLWEAAEIVVSSNLGSTSALQRRLKVGYARAGRIMDMLEEKGIVGPANGSKPREVYVDELELENIRAMAENDML